MNQGLDSGPDVIGQVFPGCAMTSARSAGGAGIGFGPSSGAFCKLACKELLVGPISSLFDVPCGFSSVVLKTIEPKGSEGSNSSCSV